MYLFSGPNYEFTKAIDVWYSGREKYDFNNPGFKPGAGNFTQLVWTDSKKIGVGAAQAKRFVSCLLRLKLNPFFQRENIRRRSISAKWQHHHDSTWRKRNI